MIELVQLEKRHDDFDRRKVRVCVVSLEGQDDAAKTQTECPHLTIVADREHRLISVAGVLHEKANPHGGDAATPTTILIDRQGIVRWIYRPEGVLRRLSPDELLAAVDSHLP